MNNNPDHLCADLCVEMTRLISHQSSLHNFLKPDNCHVVPTALLSVLAATIVFNFERRGHKALIQSSAEKLEELVEAAWTARNTMTKEQIASVNPMEPCGCSTPSTDDAIGSALERAIAEALGLDPNSVKAVKVDPSKATVDPREAAAMSKSDDAAELAKMAEEVNAMLSKLFGGEAPKQDGTKH